MFAPKRPDKAVAHKELRKHLLTLGIFCLAVRATPYLLQAAHSRSSY
jgi:hypothetical protein